jgi:hypothetical protein
VFRPRPQDGPFTVLANRIYAARGFRRDQLQAPKKGFPREILPKESLAVALRRALFDGGVNEDTQQPRSLFARNLILPDQVLIEANELKAFRDNPEKALSNIARSTVLRGRDLRDARLSR